MVGWSWLFPPYRWQFDARAVGAVRATAFDGVCLRDKCDADPALGYDLMWRFAQVLVERLQWTRLRLLDVYGHAAALSSRAVGDGAPALPRRVAGSRRPHDTWTLELEPVTASRSRSRPGQFTMLYAFGDRRGADLGHRGRAEPASSSRRCVPSVPCHEAICAAEPGDGARRTWAVRERVAGRAGGGRRPRDRRGRHRPRAAARRACTTRSRPRSEFGAVVLCTAAGPRPICSRRRARACGARVDARGRRHRRHRRAKSGTARSASSPKLIPTRAFDPAAAAALVVGPEIMMRFTVAGAARARACRRSGSTSRWSATCAAASAGAAIASSARR